MAKKNDNEQKTEKFNLLEWEDIDGVGYIQRAKVPGGWLVKIENEVNHVFPDGRFENGWNWRPALTFVPDPEHEWGTDPKSKLGIGGEPC